MKKISVQNCGRPQWPRYFLQDDAGRVWSGQGWCDDQSRAVLFDDWNEVSHLYRRLEEQQWSALPSRDFQGVINLKVWSAAGYSVEQLQDYMNEAVRILLDHKGHGTGPVPDSLVRIDIDWNQLSEAQPRDKV